MQVPEECACVRVRVRFGRATKVVVVWSQSVDGAIGVAILTLLIDGLRIGGGRASMRQRSLVRYDRERTAWLTSGGRPSQLSAVCCDSRATAPQPGMGLHASQIHSAPTADWAAAVDVRSRLRYTWPSQGTQACSVDSDTSSNGTLLGELDLRLFKIGHHLVT